MVPISRRSAAWHGTASCHYVQRVKSLNLEIKRLKVGLTIRAKVAILELQLRIVGVALGSYLGTVK